MGKIERTEPEILYNQMSDLFIQTKRIVEIHNTFATTCLDDVKKNPMRFRSLIAEMLAALPEEY